MLNSLSLRFSQNLSKLQSHSGKSWVPARSAAGLLFQSDKTSSGTSRPISQSDPLGRLTSITARNFIRVNLSVFPCSFLTQCLSCLAIISISMFVIITLSTRVRFRTRHYGIHTPSFPGPTTFPSRLPDPTSFLSRRNSRFLSKVGWGIQLYFFL